MPAMTCHPYTDRTTWLKWQRGFQGKQERSSPEDTVCTQSAGGALAFLWQVEGGSSPSPRASLGQSIPRAEHPSFCWAQQQQAANKGLPTIQLGAGPLNYPSHPPAKKNVLLRKERIRCCSTKDGIVRKRVKSLNRQPRVWNGLWFKVQILPMSY